MLFPFLLVTIVPISSAPVLQVNSTSELPTTTKKPASAVILISVQSHKRVSYVDGEDDGLLSDDYYEEYEDEESTVPTTSIPGFITTAVSGITRVCSCDEAAACRKRSLEEINWCMRTCDNHLQEYGNQTESYLECFSKNPASVIEAENCLFAEMKEHCTTPDETLFLEWKKPTEVKYASDPHHTIKRDLFWKRAEKKYNHIQHFLHCTKHCVHKQLHKCTSTKGCVVRLPKHEILAAKMRECTKKNTKISQSLLSTCQCLAWQNNVTHLRGSCVVIGNQYYVDRA